MPARATHLNRHGAAVEVNRELAVGATVMMQNGRRAQAPARIVAQVSVLQGLFTYGVEFVEGEKVKDFWGITFPTQV